MTYKFLNTIIDDLFAFVIKMPLLHRLSGELTLARQTAAARAAQDLQRCGAGRAAGQAQFGQAGTPPPAPTLLSPQRGPGARRCPLPLLPPPAGTHATTLLPSAAPLLWEMPTLPHHAHTRIQPHTHTTQTPHYTHPTHRCNPHSRPSPTLHKDTPHTLSPHIHPPTPRLCSTVFRDDVVFLIYLYQRWIYRVDKKRANEFGCAGRGRAVAAAQGRLAGWRAGWLAVGCL